LNVFVEVDHGKALEIIRSERASMSKLLNAYNQELMRLSQYYNALRSAVEQALATAARQQQ
jgi:prefoldin subunit 5